MNEFFDCKMFHYHSPAVQHRHLGEFGWRLAAARDGGQREGLAVPGQGGGPKVAEKVNEVKVWFEEVTPPKTSGWIPKRTPKNGSRRYIHVQKLTIIFWYLCRNFERSNAGFLGPRWFGALESGVPLRIPIPFITG